jgi:hypothetical protein
VLPRWTDSRPRDYAIIVDASRSMVGERLARAARLARGMIAEMDPRDRVTVLACDTSCRQMPGGLAYAGATTVHLAEQFLAGEEAMGASDLVAQVRAAAATLVETVDRDARIVYLGDGAATVGWRRPDHVAAEVARAMPGAHASLTAVALGADADTTVLGAMARAGGGAIVPYVPGETLETAALSVLETTYGVMLRDPHIELPSGLTDSAPTALGTIRAGGEAIVVARMSAPEVHGDVVLRGTVGGEPFEARWPVTVRSSSSAGNAFVPRLFAATKIAELESEPDGGASAREQIVALSQRFRVASRYTSLLVLESDAMYRAFGVERLASDAGAWTGDETAEATTAAPMTTGVLGGAHGGRAEGVDEVPTDLAGATLGSDHDVAGFGGLAAQRGYGGGGGSGAGRAGAEPAAVGEAQEELDTTTPVPSGAGDQAEQPQSVSRSAPVGHHASVTAIAAAPLRVAQPPASPAPGPVNAAATESVRRARFGGQWMRRIFVRRATIGVGAGGGDSFQIDSARRALLAAPDSRARHRDLYRVLSLAGRFDEAADVATRWSTRDALDPDAIVRLSDAAARHGDRDRAVRILAGTVDVRPDDVDAQRRMAVLHERAGDLAEACAYRVSIAEVRSLDEAALSDAVRCERTLGQADGETRLLTGVTDGTVRARVATAAGGVGRFVDQTPRGELVASATWDTPVDLDVALIDPRGNRVTWLGGRSAGLTTRGARDTRSEGLGVSRASIGGWVVEISRASSDTRTIRGSIDLSALGQRRSVAFTLLPADTTARVARVDVTREMQLVPATSVWQ